MAKLIKRDNKYFIQKKGKETSNEKETKKMDKSEIKYCPHCGEEL